MKKYKLLLVSFMFMISFFLINMLVDFFENGFDFSTSILKRNLMLSVFTGIFIGVAIKFKWIKTKNILQE